MKEYLFYKEPDGKWYIDLPDWTGSKSDLEMVAGADFMLDELSEGKKDIILLISDDEMENSYKLEFVRKATEYENGAFYQVTNYNNQTRQIWLCDVTKFVFDGYFPEYIYLKQSEL